MKISEGNRLRVLYFLVLSCTASWLPIFADYLKDRGLSGIQIGVVLSITPFMMFVIQPFAGLAADRLGYKRALVISSLLSSLSFALFMWQGSFAYLAIITVLMSLFYNTIQPLLDSLSLTLTEKDSSFSYGTLRLAGAFGWASTGTVVGHYIDELNTTVIFFFSAATMLLTFVFALSLKTDSNHRSTTSVPSFDIILKILSDRALMLLLLCVFLVSAGATTIWNFYSIYMKENGASASLVGYGISAQGLCELPLFYFSARIISLLGVKRTLVITVAATSLRMFLYSLTKDPVLALFIELLHGFSWSLFWVVCVEYVNKLIREDWRATGQSLLYAAYFGVGAIAGNFWTGYLYESNMAISAIFMLNAIAIFAVAVVVLFLMKEPKVKPLSA